MQNEQIISTGVTHWWGYAPGALLSGFGLLLIISSGIFGWLMLIAGMVLLVRSWMHATSTELAITNKRVIAKFGFFRRSTIELLHSKVESFHVDQGIVGRMLNFGTVVVNGTGGAKTPIPNIASPLDFRRQALEAIENNHKGS